MRDEAALSRLYGGIHYNIDKMKPAKLMARVGDYTLCFAQSDAAGSITHITSCGIQSSRIAT